MNIELYNQILDEGLSRFAPPEPDQEDLILRTYEVESTRLTLRLLEAGLMKVSAHADDGFLSMLKQQVVTSLVILYIAVRKVSPGMTPEEVLARFHATVQRMRQVSQDKNNDYSPYNIFKAGNIGLATRIGDKISRINNNLLQGTTLKVKDEGVLDTALDLVNYCTYHILIALDVWVTDAEREAWMNFLWHSGGRDIKHYYVPVGRQPVEAPNEHLNKAATWILERGHKFNCLRLRHDEEPCTCGWVQICDDLRKEGYPRVVPAH